jgi:spore coat polysaccharide biosynthesis protein SpsF
MQRVGIIVQARMNSSRLPGKVMKVIGGRTVLEWHLFRLAQSNLPRYVATTVNESDDVIAELAKRCNVEVWRGDEDDVLARYLLCATHFGLDIIVRTTSDCPLIDGNCLARFVDDHRDRSNAMLYLCNSSSTYPRGSDFEIFTTSMLRIASSKATSSNHREHVTSYLRENPEGLFDVERRQLKEDKSYQRFTLDTPEDLQLLRVLIEEYDAANLGLDEIIALLDQETHLLEINRLIKQKPS